MTYLSAKGARAATENCRDLKRTQKTGKQNFERSLCSYNAIINTCHLQHPPSARRRAMAGCICRALGQQDSGLDCRRYMTEHVKTLLKLSSRATGDLFPRRGRHMWMRNLMNEPPPLAFENK